MSFEALKKIFLLGLFVMSHNCQYFLGLIPTSVTLRTTLGETSACEQHDATVMDNNYNDNIIVIVSSNLAFSIQSSWNILDYWCGQCCADKHCCIHNGFDQTQWDQIRKIFFEIFGVKNMVWVLGGLFVSFFGLFKTII